MIWSLKKSIFQMILTLKVDSMSNRLQKSIKPIKKSSDALENEI